MARLQLCQLVWPCLVLVCTAQKFQGESCEAGPNLYGECTVVEECEAALEDIKNRRKPVVCSYNKDKPIVCCVNPNIISSPQENAYIWPTQEGFPQTQRPLFVVQRPTQRPSGGQRPTQPPFGGQRPNQPPVGGQRPTQPSFGGQRPTQPSFAGQGPNQQPSGGQNAPQRPVESPGQAQDGPSLKPTRRPWWQIPNRKTTESPSVIDTLPTLPMRVR